ncbi:MAG: hypothetical protein ABI579_02060 [Candidatus Sumerlaeota bacterium]
MSIDLWFLRDDNVLQCYARESGNSPLILPGGRTIVKSDRREGGGSVMELLGNDGKVCGLQSFVTPGSFAASLFENCVNAELQSFGATTAVYVLALGETAGHLGEVRRANKESSVYVSCGFDVFQELDDGTPVLTIYAWYEWVGKEKGLLRIENENVFACAVRILP